MAANCGRSNEFTPPSFSVEVKRYGINHETDLPTEPPQASQQARLPRADGHQERTPRAGAPSPERSQESDRERYEEPQVRDLSTTPNPDDGRVRRFTFPRAHRLKRRRLIRPLFDRTRRDVGTVASGSVRIIYRVATVDEVGADVPLQIGFSAGRRARSGVVRNRIRRLLREVYRVNQHLLIDLFDDRPGVLTLMVLFRSDPETADEAVPADLPRAMERLRSELTSARNETSM